jgi:phenylacetate-CoA ligase
MSTLKRILFRETLRRNGPWLERLDQLRRWQAISPSEGRALRDARLEQILKHAAARVPYYRELFRERGLVARGKLRAASLSEIPCLDRETLRSRFDDLRSEDLGSRVWQPNSTGGSTGQPVRFLRDREDDLWKGALEFLFDEWSGFDFGMKRIRLWGSERDLFVGRETPRVRAYRWVRNELWLNCFRMTPEEMRGHVDKINAFRPAQILAYAEAIFELARFIERHRLEVRSPACIMTSAGTTTAESRAVIERVFRAPVFNRYGSREFGGIACEDGDHAGLVVGLPTRIVEILRPDGTEAGPMEEGEVVVTSLTNYAMPLIRYRIGDLALWGDAPSSSRTAWPLLRQVTGRTTDAFVRPDGGIVSPIFFIHLIGVTLHRGWLRKFQLVQEKCDRLVLRLALEAPFAPDSPDVRDGIREITGKIRVAMGEDCRIEFRFEEEIPAEASGKYRYVVSHVAR